MCWINTSIDIQSDYDFISDQSVQEFNKSMEKLKS